MQTPFRIVAVLVATLALAGFIYSQPQSSSPVDQLQTTIQRLQTEIKALQSTLAQLKGNQKADAKSTVTSRTPSAIQQSRVTYNDGRRLEDQKLYRAAIDAFSTAIALDSMNDTAYLHRAYCYHQLGEDRSAVDDFTQSLAVQPNNSRAYLGRATSYAAMGQRAVALDDADEALRRDPNNFEAYLLRGRLYQQQGDSQKALADFDAAQTISPESERPYLSRAETNLHDGKNNEAIADCDTVVRMNPNLFSAYLCRAQAYVQMGKSDRAVEEISRAAQTAQSMNMPLAFLNDTWRALDPRDALPTPARAPARTIPAKLPPPPAEPRQSAAANPLVNTATISTTPNPLDYDKPSVLDLKSITLAEHKDFPTAFAFIDRAISLDPTRAHSYHTRGLLNLWLRRLDQAVNDFSEAIRLNPSYGIAYRNRAIARRTLGDLKQAKEDDQKADALPEGGMLAAKR